MPLHALYPLGIEDAGAEDVLCLLDGAPGLLTVRYPRISRTIFFLSMVWDDLFKDSELNEKDIDEIDHRIKRGIAEKLGWR